MYNFAGEYIYANSHTSPKNHSVCEQMAILLATSSFKTNALIVFSMNLICSAPLYKLFFTDENEMVIPVILPFIDPETPNGFYINLANQLFICAYGVITIPATELITCVLKNTISVSAAVIENTLLEFEGLLMENEELSSKRSWQFRNIVLKILDYERCGLIFWTSVCNNRAQKRLNPCYSIQ